MNFWQRTIARMQALVKRDDPDTINFVYSGATAAGETVTPERAMRQAVVWACVTYLARTVAQLPWRVLTDVPQTREMRGHAVHRLLRVRPNPEMSPFTFKETMVGAAARYGNAIAEIEFNNRSEPIALWPIHPDRVDFVRDEVTGELLYRIWSSGEPITYLRGPQVLHLRGFGDGAVGLNVVAYAAESIGWARATEVFGASYFGQGVAPSGLLSMKGKLSPEGLRTLETKLEEKFAGARKAHKTMIVDFDASYQRFAPDPQVAQLVETRQHQVEEICRWFGVPPHKVMHLLRSTFSNIEHQSIEVVVDSITPWCLRLEEEADYKLFGANRLALYTKFDLKGLLRGDYKSRQEGLQIMRRNGVINADEWRALEDMNPLPEGAGGDQYIVEGNMVALDKLGQAAPPAPPPPRADAGEQSDADEPDDVDDVEDDDEPIVQRARRQRERAQRSVH